MKGRKVPFEMAARVLAEFKAEGGGVPMQELLGLPPAEDGQKHEHGRRKT